MAKLRRRMVAQSGGEALLGVVTRWHSSGQNAGQGQSNALEGAGMAVRCKAGRGHGSVKQRKALAWY